MPHALRVHEVVRWTAFNEYEGEIHGELDGIPVTCYVLAVPVEQWDNYRAGTTVNVDAWIERSAAVETLPEGSQAELTQVGGVIYDVTGPVAARDGEQLQVHATLRIRVDLDLAVGTEAPPLRIGDVVRVRGTLKVDLSDQA